MTGLSWLFLEGGNAFGFIIGPLMVTDPPKNSTVQYNNTSLPGITTRCHSLLLSLKVMTGNETELGHTIKLEVMYFMTLHAGLAVLLFLLLLLYYPARPKNLPSFTAGEKREDFLQGLKSFMSNKSAVLVCVAFTLSQGVAEAFYPVLDLDLAPIGVSETTTGYIGFISSVVAGITCFVISFGVERMKGSYKMIIIVLLLMASLFYTWQTLIVTRIIAYSELQLYISTIAGIHVYLAKIFVSSIVTFSL